MYVMEWESMRGEENKREMHWYKEKAMNACICCLLKYMCNICLSACTFMCMCGGCCTHIFACMCVRMRWCNAEARCVPTIPSFSFFAAPRKEPEPLCVGLRASQGPIVRLSKPVCSGHGLTYRGELLEKERGGGRWRAKQKCWDEKEKSFGRWTALVGI